MFLKYGDQEVTVCKVDQDEALPSFPEKYSIGSNTEEETLSSEDDSALLHKSG